MVYISRLVVLPPRVSLLSLTTTGTFIRRSQFVPCSLYGSLPPRLLLLLWTGNTLRELEGWRGRQVGMRVVGEASRFACVPGTM